MSRLARQRAPIAPPDNERVAPQKWQAYGEINDERNKKSNAAGIGQLKSGGPKAQREAA
jgi:hypothetical protein